MTSDEVSKTAPVPTGRIPRLWQLGLAAGGLAASAAAHGLGDLLRGERPDLLALSPADGRRLAERLSRMRGAAMKIGQLLSMNGKDLLPPEFVELLAPLRQAAHVMPFGQIVGVLEREYGRDWNKRFRRFEFTPVAAASIGQVHRAETRDGRRLAIKVQYPGVKESIDSDIDNLSALVRLFGLGPAGIELTPLLEEARRQLHREADYGAEAASMETYGALIGVDPVLQVPAVQPDFCTPSLLAMDFADGVPIDRLASEPQTRAVRDLVATALSRLMLRELFEFGLVQTDPNFANYLYDERDGRILLLDFGAARPVRASLAERYRTLARAAIDLDRNRVREAAVAIGFLGADDTPTHMEGLVDLILLAAEPLRHRGDYDFGASDLFLRANDLGQDLVFRRGFKRTPPTETAFLHRKFVGSFMLCARLRARINVGAITAPWLA